MSDNLSYLSSLKGLDEGLFERLEDTKSKELAQEFLVGEAVVYGSLSFYEFLKPENKDKKVFICNGTSCMLARSQNKVEDELRKKFGDAEIGTISCLGRCHENAAFQIQGQNYSNLTSEQYSQVLGQKAVEPSPSVQDEYLVQSTCEDPILTRPSWSQEQITAFLQLLEEKMPYDLLDEINKSCLRGRGGAGFPIGRKLITCAEQKSDEKYIICNADEGDPGAFSDRYLLEHQPMLVLLGMVVAAEAVGARTCILYIRFEYPDSVRIIEENIKRLLKEHVLPGGLKFKIVRGAGSYICGEETALINSIEGQRPEVRTRPPYPVVEGLFGQPTVVNNVETLACLPFIVQKGGDAFALRGTKKSTGTKLVTLDGAFNKPGLFEVEMGTSLTSVVYGLGSGFRNPVKAIHIGGPLGGLVPLSAIDELSIDFESFKENGFLLGHGSCVGIPQDYPLLEYIKHLFEFTAEESCGKCFPCRLGSVRGKELAENMLEKNEKISLALFNDLLETLELGSLCALGGGLPLPIKNALNYFQEELAQAFAD